MENYYYRFGVNAPVSKDVTDPVQCCLAGKYLNCPENPFRFDATACNNFMVDRCSKQWDDKCTQFLADIYEPQSVKSFASDPTFLEEVARRKYCMLDKNDPDAKCVELCEPLNPLDQTSATICSIYGTEISQNDKYLQDIAGDFPATAKLKGSAPVKIGKCPILCQGVDKIQKDDPVIDACLATGKCMDVMMQLSQYAIKNNLTVENEKFKKFMDYYTGLTPPEKSLLAKESASLLVPSNESPKITQRFSPPTQFGQYTILPGKKQHTLQSMPKNTVYNHRIKYQIETTNNFLSDNKVLCGLFILLVLGGVYYCMNKK